MLVNVLLRLWICCSYVCCVVCVYIYVIMSVYGCVCVCVFSSEFVVVVLASRAAPRVAAARLVLVSWMAKRPGRGGSLML